MSAQERQQSQPVRGRRAPSSRHSGARRLLVSASDTQRALLPPACHTGRLAEAAAVTRPRWAIGGDFYDYVDTDREFRVILGDACGNGTAAALQASLVQGVLAIEAGGDGGPARLMTRLNRALCRRAIPARFVALFHGILLSHGRLVYCNAGMCRPLLVNRHGVYRLSTGGPPLGMFPEARFEEAGLDLHTGDLLFVASDGLLEAVRGRDGEEFGDDRVLHVLSEHRARSAREIVGHLMTAVEEFVGEAGLRDDMTAIVVRYRV